MSSPLDREHQEILVEKLVDAFRDELGWFLSTLHTSDDIPNAVREAVENEMSRRSKNDSL